MISPTRSSWRAPSTSILTSPAATKRWVAWCCPSSALPWDGFHPGHLPRPAGAWNTFETGCAYAAMGFTTVVEPAVSPHHALQAHLELADIPIIDKATLTVLGNDDFLLEPAAPARRRRARSGIMWPGRSSTSRGLGIKVINAGGAAAFKDNVRAFSLDDEVPVVRRFFTRNRQGAPTRRARTRRAASAACPLQQSRPRRQCRDRTGNNRGSGRPAAASRAFAVLRLRQGGTSAVSLRPARAWRKQ